MARNYTGSHCDTADSLLLNAGAYFKNFDMENDTYESAMAAGKCLGATQGGGSFVATPEIRYIEIDGADPIPVIDAWVVTQTANLIEVKPDTLKIALGTGVIADHSPTYFSIKAKRNLDRNDYLDNITWVGTLSGSNEPVIIQIFNAVNTTGLTVNVAPKGQAVLAVTFTAKSDDCKNSEDVDFAPFVIYYPKSVARIEINPVTDTDITVTGTGLTGATVSISGGSIPAGATAIVANGEFTIAIPAQTVGTQITGYQEIDGKRSLEASVYVEHHDEEEAEG